METRIRKRLPRDLESNDQRRSKIQTFKDKAYGYAVYPKITKAGLVIGGAGGEGVVYKGGAVMGSSKLGQGTFGLQAGGQQYSEVIFFETKTPMIGLQEVSLNLVGRHLQLLLPKGLLLMLPIRKGVAVFRKGRIYAGSFNWSTFFI